MEEIGIFDGISPELADQMLKCFAAVRRKYPAEATVLNYTGGIGPVCVVLSGEVAVECLDAEGNQTVLETLGPDCVFGELFSPPTEPLVYTAIARTPCEVLFIDYTRVVTHCTHACAHHNQLVNNLFRIAARKVQALSKRLCLLTQRTLRQKLLLYLEYAAAEAGADEFELPITLSGLADYISADRSAMMRELGRMREEGLICSRGRRFRLNGPS